MAISYPIKKTAIKTVKEAANRGKTLEDDINATNEHYLANDYAVIHKKPTPIQVVDVHYPARTAAKIIEAYYKTPSTTDYNGCFQGYYIDFEAKETTATTSFPLKNIHPHQIEHLFQVEQHGGIGFIIVFFSKLNRHFLITQKTLHEWWKQRSHGRQSIPLSIFITEGYELKTGYHPRIDYLDIVKNHLIPQRKKPTH